VRQFRSLGSARGAARKGGPYRDPGRKPHDALDALTAGICQRKVSWVLDADIRDFFGSLDRGWLGKFLRHRIADERVLRLVGKWLAAGVIEDGKLLETGQGSPQGAPASPLLANVYLHYVLDLWAKWWRKHHARGDVIIVRFADDFVAGFQYQDDAEKFLAALRERFARFSLELHPGKTRLIEFGRYAAPRRKARGLGKPETFSFLGFTHICALTRKGRFQVRRVTDRKRLRAKLKQVKAELMRRRHLPGPEQGRWLRTVITGHQNYYAVPGNYQAVRFFRTEATRHWRHALSRRSQKGRVTWERMDRIARHYLPRTRITHPYPEQRFAATHPW
jgi:RNA-directed DNA polymerase